MNDYNRVDLQNTSSTYKKTVSYLVGTLEISRNELTNQQLHENAILIYVDESHTPLVPSKHPIFLVQKIYVARLPRSCSPHTCEKYYFHAKNITSILYVTRKILLPREKYYSHAELVSCSYTTAQHNISHYTMILFFDLMI